MRIGEGLCFKIMVYLYIMVYNWWFKDVNWKSFSLAQDVFRHFVVCHLTDLMSTLICFINKCPLFPLTFALLQTHDPSWPEKLYVLAKGECRCHSVCCSWLRHVQSSPQAAVISASGMLQQPRPSEKLQNPRSLIPSLFHLGEKIPRNSYILYI